jgi:hypothetical protein
MPITTADIAQILADWGEPVTHRTVVATFDPDTQSVSEATTDVALTALVTTAEQRPAPGAAGHATTELHNFRVTSTALPALPAGAVRRLVHDGQEYDVLEVDHNDATGITRLTGQRRT